MILLIMLGSGICVLAAEPPRKLTLAECLQVAEQQHPDLAAARGLITEAQAQVKAARSGLLPHIDTGGSYTRQSYIRFRPDQGPGPARGGGLCHSATEPPARPRPRLP
ncbi:MAG: TolC family protein [Acidobacteriia bacterium]|nr:TolC family protein [Terriglobia bacterium]